MIRPATEADLQAILDIYNDAVINTTAVYTYTPHTLDMRRQWFNEHREAGLPVFVLEEDGVIAGFATYGNFRPWPPTSTASNIPFMCIRTSGGATSPPG